MPRKPTKPRRPAQMFLGPMQVTRNPDTHRVTKVAMELFGGPKAKPVILAYGDLAEARKQRRSLMQAGNIAAVSSARLVKAILTAFGQVVGQKSKIFKQSKGEAAP